MEQGCAVASGARRLRARDLIIGIRVGRLPEASRKCFSVDRKRTDFRSEDGRAKLLDSHRPKGETAARWTTQLAPPTSGRPGR
jgi:hypothetical protein